MNGENIPTAGKPGIFYGWRIVAVTWLPVFLTNAVAFALFFKPILEEFQLERATLSLVQTAALLVFAAASPFLGRLIDRFGPKAILVTGTVTQAASSVITGLSGTIWHLFVSRFLFEMKPLHSTQVLLNRWFVSRRGRALGISATSLPIGMLALSPLSQYLVQTWGWRETLLFWSAVTLLLILPLIIFVKNNPEDKGYGPDGQPPLRKEPAISVAGKRQAGAGYNITGALHTGSFWLLLSAHLICGFGCGFMMTHIVIFATDVGYSAMVGASLLSVQGAVNFIGVLVTGQLSDRMARNRVLSLTHFIRSLAFITVVIFISLGGASLWLLYIAIAMFGFGFFTTSPLTAGLVADLFGNLRMGTIMGVVFSSHIIGSAIGSYAGGLIFDTTGSYYYFFAAQGVLELLAAVCAFAIKRHKTG